MIINARQKAVLDMALEHYGFDHQCLKATEELAELIKELCLHMSTSSSDHDRHNVPEELADVVIVVSQLLSVFNTENRVQIILNEKIQRLERRIRNEQIEKTIPV